MTPTQKFNYVNSTGKLPPKRQVSTHGVLYHKGHPITNPAPYALLQTIKRTYINNGCLAKDLKIRKY